MSISEVERPQLDVSAITFPSVVDQFDAAEPGVIDLREPDLREPDLRERDLRERDLRERDLREPDLRGRLTPAPRSRVPGASVKRAIDVVLALVVIALTLPVLLLVAAAIFVTDPGPVFFRQTRVGRDGRPFRIVKFRTMVIDAEHRLRRDPELYAFYLANDHKVPLDRDPRVTRIGRLLRTSSLDELPQLFNVLGGSMSLVGPRPVVRSELSHYGELTDSVLSVRPGMTGLWQVSGRSRVPYPERAHLDAKYTHTWSIRRDAAILWRTIGAVARRVGAD